MATKRQPSEGDRVWCEVLYPEERRVEGTVIDVLASQFTLETDNGNLEWCFYGDQWGVIDDRDA